MLANDSQRSPHFDDALFSLPQKGKTDFESRKRMQIVAAALGAEAPTTKPKRRNRKPAAIGYRHRPYIGHVGAIVTAKTEIGDGHDQVQFGQRGIVIRIEDTGSEQIYTVIWQTGAIDRLDPSAIDQLVQEAGLTSELGWYRFENEFQAAANFRGGRFNFYPVAVEITAK